MILIVRCGMTAECGNQQCELGEACSLGATSTAQVAAGGATDTTSGCCPADCPVAVQSCAADAATGVACSGHGSCLSGTGVCRCFDGYTGDACDSCAALYVSRDTGGSGNGNGAATCVLLPGSLSTCTNGVRDGREVGVDCGGVCPPCNGTTAGDLISTATQGAGGKTVFIEAMVAAAGIGGVFVGGAVGAAVWYRRRATRRAVHRPRDPSRRRVGSVTSSNGGVLPARGERTDGAGRRDSRPDRQSRGSVTSAHSSTSDGRKGSISSSGVKSPEKRVRFSAGASQRDGPGQENPRPSRSRTEASEVPASRVVPWGTVAAARLVKVQPAAATTRDGSSNSTQATGKSVHGATTSWSPMF